MPKPELLSSRWPAPRYRGAWLLASLALGAACSAAPDPAETSGGSTTGPGGGSSTSTSTSSTGGGGSGGEGGGGLCVPGSTASCYGGPPGTEGMGICAAGVMTCDATGMAYGPCVGEVVPATELCATAEDEDCNGVVSPCPEPPLFAALYGDASGSYGKAVAVDATGDWYVVGSFAGTIDFGDGPLTSAGGRDIVVAKLDSAGNAIWSKRFGGAMTDYGSKLAFDPLGNVILTGGLRGPVDFGGGPISGSPDPTQHAIFLAKLDSAGNHVFSKAFACSGNTGARGLAVGPSGEIVLANQFRNTINLGGVDFTADDHDMFVARFDAMGNHLGSDQFGGPGDQYMYAVAIDAAGDIVLGGGFEEAVDLGGGLLTSVGSYDIFLAKLDALGGHVWSQRMGGGGEDGIVHLAVDAGGDIGFSAASVFEVDFGGGPVEAVPAPEYCFLVRMSPEGQHIWSRGHGCEIEDGNTPAVAFDADSNLLVTGFFNGTTTFGGGMLTSTGRDIFVVKVDPAGAHVWSRSFGSLAQDIGHGIADAGGSVLVTGTVGGHVDFGGGALISQGASDLFLLELQP